MSIIRSARASVPTSSPASAKDTCPSEQRPSTTTDDRSQLLERIELTRVLYRQGTIGAIASNFVVPSLIVFGLWDAVPRVLLVAWLALCTSVGIFRLAIYMAFNRAEHVESSIMQWQRYAVIAAALSGVVWGSSSYLVYLPGALEYQLLLGLALAGLTLGAVGSLSSHMPAFVMFFLPSMAPYALAWLTSPDRLRVVIALLVMTFMVVVYLFAKNQGRSLRESLRLRFANLELVDELTLQKNEVIAQKNEAERANVAKSRFLAAASHDLRQPMHALGLFVETLRSQISTREGRRLLTSIEASIDAMDGLFNALLDISRLDAGVVRPNISVFMIDHLLARLKNEFLPQAAAKGLMFSVVRSSLVISSDYVLLERILGNLLSNALRYTTCGRVLIGCRRRGQHVCVEVWDTGPGIPAERRQDIFHEFVQLGNPERDRSKGLGLGLAIVERTARLLNHEIRMDSRVGRGSRFVIVIPAADPSLAHIGAARPLLSADSQFNGKVVLVIDDELAIRSAMRALLESWGCRVTIAASANDAIGHLAEGAQQPHVIIADYRLRDDESGVDAIRRVHAHIGRLVPALLITGDTAPERLREAEHSGYKLIHKPVRPARLRVALSNVLKSSRPQVPAADVTH